MACSRFALKRLLSSTASITRRSSSAVVVPPFRHPSITNYNFSTTRRGFFSDMFDRFSSLRNPSATAAAAADKIPNPSPTEALNNLFKEKEKRDMLPHQILDHGVDVFLFLLALHHPDMIKYVICLTILKGFINTEIVKSWNSLKIDLLKVSLDDHRHDDQDVQPQQYREAPRFRCFHTFEFTKDDGFHVFLTLHGPGIQDPNVFICGDKLVVASKLRSPSGKEMNEFIDLPRYVFDHYDPYKFTSHVLEGGRHKFSFPNAKEPVVKPVPFQLKLN